MNFVSTMVKLFGGMKFKDNLFFKYGARSYQITEVTDEALKYIYNDEEDTLSARSHDFYEVMEMHVQGSRLINNRSVTIHIQDRSR